MDQDIVQLRTGHRIIASGRLYRAKATNVAAVFLDSSVPTDDLDRVTYLFGFSARHLVTPAGRSGEVIAFFRVDQTEDYRGPS